MATAPSAGGLWKNGSSKCQGRRSSTAHPKRRRERRVDVALPRRERLGGGAVDVVEGGEQAVLVELARSRARARSGRGSRGRAAASLRSRASSRMRSATSGPICFDASHAARRSSASSLVRRISAISLSSTRRPSMVPRKLLNIDSTAVSSSTMARRRSAGTWWGTNASWSRSSWRGAERIGAGIAGDVVAGGADCGERRRGRRGSRGGRARRRCGAPRPRATTGCSTPTTPRPARPRAVGGGLRCRRRARREARHGGSLRRRTERRGRRRASQLRGRRAASTARAWRASGSSTICPSNAIAASPRATASS